MRSYVEAAARHDNVTRTVRLLERIVPEPRLHARFVNTLARMEYVGVRKMLKSRRAERLDLDGIQHILDEAVHTMRLKKAAIALDRSGTGEVRTFATADTLAGDAGENYLQALDHRAEEMLAEHPADLRSEANYLLTSAAVEVRAQVFYPIYDRLLKEHQAGFSVAAITKDEDRHLEEMAAGLEAVLPNWKPRLEPLLAAEEALFARFLAAIEQAVAATAGHG
jgi:hypothetical protein